MMTYRILFAALGCLMAATLVYTFLTDGTPFRREILTPWMDATLVDFYINVLAIAVWIAYKECSWFITILWVLLIICFGSIATSAYILKELFSVSSQDHVQDPLNHLLLRSGDEVKTKCYSVMFGRILFSVLGFLMLAILVFTSVTDGLPFRMELLTPWLAATLIDFYIHIFAISVWVVHKEPTWVGAVCWVCLLICFGSVATCAYITIQLFRLSRKDLAYEVLLDSNSKHVRAVSST